MGADGFIATKDIKATVAEHGQKFDILLCTTFQTDMPLNTLYFPLLKPKGNMIVVGLPESDLPALRPQSLFGKSLTGSLIGSPKDIEEMFATAVKHNVRPWIQTRPMHEASQVAQGELEVVTALRRCC